MNKALKITLIILCGLLIISLCSVTYILAVTSTAKLDDDKLVNLSRVVAYYDKDNKLISETDNGNEIVSIDEIPSHVKNAFIAIEDKRFYSHHGIDYKGLVRAALNNVKSFSFKEGASTISQQLIKNTHLSNEKTLKRKLVEMKLAKDLEKRYSKSEILEKYLNTIYFGDNCFGISKAAKHYFNKSVNDLSVEEGAILAGLIKAPSSYSPSINEEKANERKNVVLKQMLNQNLIDEHEYNVASSKKVIAENKSQISYDFINLVSADLNQIIENSRFFSEKFDVYTNFNAELQKIIQNVIDNKCNDYYFKAIILDAESNIVSYYANCLDYRRQIGSTIKPLLCYAPAIEENLVDSFSIIEDIKTNFNGYSPSNYNDAYQGKTSVKNSLIKSSNVCAVKLLNYLGVQKAKEYGQKLGLPFTENDNSLCVALGNTEKGATIKELSSAYSVFLNHGKAYSITSFKNINDANNKTIYSPIKTIKNVFSEDTIHIVNDMLNATAKTGTAKKLVNSGIDLCGKTGTVGTEKGNTDAYCISFNKDYLLSVWVGNKDGKLLPNSITGGTLPSEISQLIWRGFYNNKNYPDAFNRSNNIENIYLDKLSYDNAEIKLADENSPERFKIAEIVKKNRVPNVSSTRFSCPTIDKSEIAIENNAILIRLCQTELCDSRIYKCFNGKKSLVVDTKNLINKNEIRDTLSIAGEYTYSIVPYYFDGKNEHVGEEVLLPKIKFTATAIPKDWWRDEF